MKPISIFVKFECPDCKGTGREDAKSEANDCMRCSGNGEVREWVELPWRSSNEAVQTLIDALNMLIW